MKALCVYSIAVLFGLSWIIAPWGASASRGGLSKSLRQGPAAVSAIATAPSGRVPAFQPQGGAASLASADFDEDGVTDLVSGYALGGGTIVVQRGNVDAMFPNAPAAKARRAKGQFTDAPFLPPSRAFDIPESANFVAAGDFNADGHKDVLACAYDTNSLYLLSGNGHGDFSTKQIWLEGRITAIVTGEIGRPDGQMDIAVAIVTDKGPQLLVYEHPESAFKRKPEVFNLPAPATSIALGQLDEDPLPDIAVACGDKLVFVHGHQQIYPWDMIPESGISRPPAEIGERTFPFRIAALASGRFSNSAGDSLALLAEDGSLHLLEAAQSKQKNQIKLSLRADSKRSVNMPAGGDFQKYKGLKVVQPSAQEAARRGIKLVDRRSGAKTTPDEFDSLFVDSAGSDLSSKEKSAIVPMKKRPNLGPSFYTSPSRIKDWSDTVWLADYRFTSATQSGRKNLLKAARVSGSELDDLLVLEESAGQVQIINRDTEAARDNRRLAIGTWRSPGVATLDVDGIPTAILALRLNADALSDLVVSRTGASAQSAVLTAAANTYTVDSTDDTSGICQPGLPCTLRGAIQAANANPGADSIVFNIPGDGVHEIDPVNELPVITGPVTIDGTTQPGFAGTPLIEINGGSSVAAGADGLKVRASDCVIRGLAINSFPHFQDQDTGSFIGGNGLSLETLSNQGRHNNIIVEGNFLGTDATGTFDLGNASTGLIMFDVDSCIIGGTTLESRNVISGNGTPEETGAGISVVNGNFNQFKGNYIGINAAGDEKLPNSYGFDLTGSINTVGGDEPTAFNTISGNGDPSGELGNEPCGQPGLSGTGLLISYLSPADSNTNLTQFNSVQGNRIGTDPDGVNPLGNCFFGIDTDPITSTSIGSIAEEGRNVISDNGHYAINCTYILALVELSGGFCIVSGNNIGTDITGNFPMRNDGRNTPFPVFPGFAVVEGSAVSDAFVSIGAPGGTTPGGPCTGFCNLISGNDDGGTQQNAAVSVFGMGLTGVFNSYIGTNRSGTAALPNLSGVNMNGNTYLGHVGFVLGQPGDLTPLGNLISGNDCLGANVSAQGNFGTETLSASAKNNLIGTDVTGSYGIPNNQGFGGCNDAALKASANSFSSVVIGGSEKPGQRNVISSNGGVAGLWLQGNAIVQGNYIGVGLDGTTPLGNTAHGIEVRATSFDTPNIVGGTGPGEQNIIRNNSGAGIHIDRLFPQFGINSSITDIRANSIFDNGGLGIDIFPDGVNGNDAGDSDAGPNDLQNYPALDTPVFNGNGTVTVVGGLNSQGNQSYRIDFYSNNPADPSNYGEGQTYIGTKQITTNASGNATFTFTSSGPVSANAAIVANATNAAGKTSEFSCVAGLCVADVSVVKEDDVDPIEAGKTLTYTLTVANAGPAAAPNVVVTDNLPAANITFISAVPSQGTCNRVGNVVTCNLNTINNGAQATVVIKVTPTQVGSLTNSASVTHALSDPNPVNNSDEETTEVVNSLIVVTTTGDEEDANLNDSVCDVDPQQQENQCTLRAAIQVANARSGKDGISFDIPGGGIKTITPQSALPPVDEQALIDATSQPGYAGTPVVELNGSQAGAGLPGFRLNSGNTTLKGFAINRWGSDGIRILNNGNNVVEACFVGTDPSGNTASGNSRYGIYLENSSGNRIGGATTQLRNVISANGTAGDNGSGFGVYVFATSGGVGNNVIQGNYIGTNVAGIAALPNTLSGVTIIGSSNNIVGGPTFTTGSAPGNVIAGTNVMTGGIDVFISGNGPFPASNNVVQGNLIGTDSSGTNAHAYRTGVLINNDADNNLIGGSAAGARNVVSGHLSGVAIASPEASGNRVEGNYIGTDITGNVGLPNTIVGVDIQGSPNNFVGGTTIGAGNVIACNGSGVTSANIGLSFLQATGNTIQGNRIGVFANGTAQTTKATFGVGIGSGAQSTLVGGTTAAARNIISGNKYGVFVIGATNEELGNNTIQGNYIGTNPGGTTPLGNEVGIGLFASFNNIIGADQSGGRNIISANAPGGGILIASGGGNNQVKNNYIGTDVSGSQDLGNSAGVAIYQSSDNHIGTENIISGNDPLGGVLILDSAAPPPPSLAQPMSFKPTMSSKNDSPSAVLQTQLYSFPSANKGTAASPAPANPNAPAVASVNLIVGNRIGLSANSQSAIPNKPAGVLILLGASANRVEGNVISGNQDTGVFIGNTQDNQPQPHDNIVLANVIGLRLGSGTPVALPNTKYGIFLLGTMNNVFTLNIVCGNGEHGVLMQAESTGNVFHQNFFGVTPEGQKSGNGKDGIKVENSPGNTIGGSNAGDGNVIGSNGENGIEVTTTAPPPGAPIAKSRNAAEDIPPTLIVGNLIGAAINTTDGTLTKAANALSGILVADTTNVQIGASGQNGGNSVVANGGAGIVIHGVGSTLNKVVNNSVGVVDSAWGSVAGFFGNEGDGIQVMDSADSDVTNNEVTDNTGVGVSLSGSEASTNNVRGNTVSNNTSHGVEITNGANRNNIGGQASGAGNTINNNGGAGINLTPSAGQGNNFDPNSIFGNTGPGIDIGGDGATANDPGDADSGPNNLQNYPEFTSAKIVPGGDLVFQYSVDSDPANADYGTNGLYIEFFKADASLQGKTFLGSTHYTAADYNNGAPGVDNFIVGNAANLGVGGGDKIVATATDDFGNTSEFTSTNVGVVTAAPTATTAIIDGDVSTSDGTPVAGVAINLSGTQSRRTITDNNGHYQFVEVETTGFYSVSPARANYTFNPANRSFSILGNRTEAVFTAIPDVMPTLNPIDSAEFFVRQHYLDFLNREPDESGFSFWSDQILGCGGANPGCIERKRINVSAAYFLSIEFQQTGGLVDRLYRASYGRRPLYAEFMPDSGTIARDVVVGRNGWEQQLAANKRAFVEAWVQRPTFVAAFGNLNDRRYTDELIGHTGVNYSQTERDALVDGLTSGALTRAQVLQRIAEDQRFVSAKFNEAFVLMEYFGYLRRDPDETGYQFWLAKLNQFNGNFEQAEMVKAFIVSGEYRARFSR